MSDQQLPPDFDPWSTETGLVSNYEGLVLDAWFGFDPKVGDGKTAILFMKVSTDQPESPEVEERWTVGPDWNTFDGGKTIEHPKGLTKKINNNTQYGHFVDRAVELGAAAIIRERGTPREAEVWIGTKWYMEAEEKTYSFTKNGQQIAGKSSRNYPTKFLGVDDVTSATSTSPQPSAGSSSPSTAPPATETATSAPSPSTPTTPSSDPLSVLDPTVAAQARLLAKAKPYADWVDAMMELPGVVENNDLIMALADENSLYSSLRVG